MDSVQDAEKQHVLLDPLPSRDVKASSDHQASWRWQEVARAACAVLGFIFLYLNLHAIRTVASWSHSPSKPSPPPPFANLSTHCEKTRPILHQTYLARQQSLVETLFALNASAYIAEPGASAAYFANLSGASWHLSERPLLLVIAPKVGEFGNVSPQVTLLTPSFEATRAKMLPVVGQYVSYTSWAEEADPYEVAVGALPQLKNGAKIFVDTPIRHFIAEGLKHAAPQARVLSAPLEVRVLRERKSQEEINILKCANEVTVLAIRAVREELYFGIRESEARTLLQEALAAAGLAHGDGLVLFGENAALPHGSGTDRVLKEGDFVLIDAGGELHGYVSDVTRTFLLYHSVNAHLSKWYLTKAAQEEAFDAAKAGVVTSEVDAAARDFLDIVGYGKYFTHRLGHGIGLEGHEAPYLRGGSKDIIQSGHTFSNEPGIYIERQVGIRLEDCFYINKDGDAVYLTEGVGGPSRSPWEP
ncbi:peptidase M24 [Auriscalpium vulgare]|uniref:Peptidase M24 n=1 Tax=Auriscalpium vulgare TaxID=40419 RepID=A0ACB8RY47_9AGAM|nr:peptidase M24 [Auriscalpium vulgare]